MGDYPDNEDPSRSSMFLSKFLFFSLTLVLLPCQTISTDENRKDEPCVDPFFSPDVFRDSPLVESLAKALKDGDLDFIGIHVTFTDETGEVFEPGTCPGYPSNPAFKAGIPLVWALARGQYGAAFTRLPSNQLRLYAIGDPLEKYQWSTAMRLFTNNSCWRELSDDSRVQKLADIIERLTFEAHVLSDVSEAGQLCYQLPSYQESSASILSLRFQLAGDAYRCCEKQNVVKNSSAKDSNATSFSEYTCSEFNDQATIVAVAEYVFFILVLYIVLFQVPQPGLALLRYVESTMKEAQTRGEENSHHKVSPLSEDRLPPALQPSSRIVTVVTIVIVLSLITTWAAVDLFVLIPHRAVLDKFVPMARTCYLTWLDISVLVASLFTLVTFFLHRLIPADTANYSTGYFTSQREYCRSFQALQIASILPAFVILTTKGIVNIFRSLWVWFQALKEVLPPQSDNGSKKLKTVMLGLPYLIFFPIEFPALLVFDVLPLVMFIPLVDFAVRSWESFFCRIGLDKRRVGSSHSTTFVEAGNFLEIHIMSLAVWCALVLSACLYWAMWVVTYDTVSFLFFTLTAHFVVHTQQTMYVLAGLFAVVMEGGRRCSKLDERLRMLTNTVVKAKKFVKFGDPGEEKLDDDVHNALEQVQKQRDGKTVIDNVSEIAIYLQFFQDQFRDRLRAKRQVGLEVSSVKSLLGDDQDLRDKASSNREVSKLDQLTRHCPFFLRWIIDWNHEYSSWKHHAGRFIKQSFLCIMSPKKIIKMTCSPANSKVPPPPLYDKAIIACVVIDVEQETFAKD